MLRTKTVKSKVKWVKTLHVLLMVAWPAAVVVFAVADSFLYQALQRNGVPFYHPLRMLLFFVWLLYVYFMMIAMRNYSLQSIATQECDFDAYLECVEYLEKFQFPRTKRSQRVNRTDALLIRGDFDAAYENLMELREQYQEMGDRTKMMYDYFWCRFYAELEDVENFHICLRVFRNTWLGGARMKRKMQAQANALMRELDFRDMLFTGRSERLRSDLSNLYESGRIGSRYEFVRYCYYMGRLEYDRNNLPVAKHWFAQTVSFGLHEFMSRRSEDFLVRMEEMQVPYAAAPPLENQYYCNSRQFSMTSALVSMLLGLLLVVVLMFV